MTAARAKVSSSLADRGRPEMWANEQESAELSGMSPNRFKTVLPALTKRGFPPINPINGKRPIPAILAFWGLRANDPAIPPEPVETSEREKENWDDFPQGQRLAS